MQSENLSSKICFYPRVPLWFLSLFWAFVTNASEQLYSEENNNIGLGTFRARLIQTGNHACILSLGNLTKYITTIILGLILSKCCPSKCGGGKVGTRFSMRLALPLALTYIYKSSCRPGILLKYAGKEIEGILVKESLDDI